VAIDYQRLERNLSREFRQYHVVAQIRRITTVFLGVLGVQLATGWNDWTWKGLLALGAAAGYGTLRQIVPTVPWKAFLGHVQMAQAVEARQIADAVVAAAAPVSPSEKTYAPVTQSAERGQQHDERPDPASAP
jgi:hypothetical protein